MPTVETGLASAIRPDYYSGLAIFPYTKETLMIDAAMQFVQEIEEAARNSFKDGSVRSDPLTPAAAADAVTAMKSAGTFPSDKVAGHLRKLPAGMGSGVRLARSASSTWLTVSIPGDRKAAFDWANALIDSHAAAGVKMNLGPNKTTDLKVFWDKPDVNTLIEIGGSDD